MQRNHNIVLAHAARIVYHITMIYHITTAAAWQAAQQTGTYTADSLASEGFIHCSTVMQVAGVAARFYRGVPDLVLLTLAPAQLGAEVRYEAPAEDPTSAERFPHVYGAIPVTAVVRVTPLLLAADGVPTPATPL